MILAASFAHTNTKAFIRFGPFNFVPNHMDFVVVSSSNLNVASIDVVASVIAFTDVLDDSTLKGGELLFAGQNGRIQLLIGLNDPVSAIVTGLFQHVIPIDPGPGLLGKYIGVSIDEGSGDDLNGWVGFR